MGEFFASGRVVDLILVLVAVEALALLAWRIRRGRGPSLATLASNLASGAALMLGMRAALTDAHWTIVAACLAASLVAHVTDLWLRVRDDAPGALGRSGPSPSPGTSARGAAFLARR